MATKKKSVRAGRPVRCRVVGFDSSIFEKATIEGKTSAWRCRFCGRLFAGRVSGNAAGFSHDCPMREGETVWTKTEDDSGDLGDA